MNPENEPCRSDECSNNTTGGQCYDRVPGCDKAEGGKDAESIECVNARKARSEGLDAIDRFWRTRTFEQCLEKPADTARQTEKQNDLERCNFSHARCLQCRERQPPDNQESVTSQSRYVTNRSEGFASLKEAMATDTVEDGLVDPVQGCTKSLHQKWLKCLRFAMLGGHVLLRILKGLQPLVQTGFRCELMNAPENSLQALLLQNKDAILRFLRARMRGETHEVEDRFHDTWIKLGRIEPKGPIRDPIPYIYKVADNVVLDARKMRNRRERRDQAWGEVSRAQQSIVGEQSISASFEIGEVEAAIGDLSERTLLIFRRARIEGYTQKEIAAELGISVSGVEKHLLKAYRRIAIFRAEQAEEIPS